MNEYNPTRTDLFARLGLLKKIVRACGHFLYDEEGTRYLDFLSQYGVMSLGHNHPELLTVLQEYLAAQRPSMIQPFTPPATQMLAEKLKEITPGELSYTVLTNSGAEATEAAIKLARARTGRQTILSTLGGFHGKTLGALSATGNPTYQRPFGAPAPHFEYVPFGDLEALETRLRADGESIAAFIVEPVQGEGGMVSAPEGYLAGLTALCRDAGALTVFDEVQTGLGRTGSLFASAGEAPDILLLGKALGGGLMPIGACVCTPDAWDHTFGLLHSSTFAGNQLACAVAIKVIELLLREDQELIKTVAEHGKYLLGRLEELAGRYPDTIKDVRGRGLMAGIEFRRYDGRDSYVMAFASMNGLLTALFSGHLLNVHQLVTAPAFNDSHFLRLEPPFTVGPAEIDQAVGAIDSLCAAIERGNYAHAFRYVTNMGKLTRPPKGFAPVVPVPRRRPEPADPHKRRSFAFLVHYTTEQDHFLTEPSLRNFTPEEFGRWQHWVADIGPGVIHHVENFTLADGPGAEGWLLVVPSTPGQLLEAPRREILDIFQRAAAMASNRGAGILGLGGFISILTRGGESLVGNDIAIDTGSCLTSLMAVDGICEVVAERGGELSTLHVAVVGATGAIGRLSAMMLADKVARITLIGNPLSPDAHPRCKAVAGDIYSRLLGCIDRPDRSSQDPPGPMVQSIDRALRAMDRTASSSQGEGGGSFRRSLQAHAAAGDSDDMFKLAVAMERAFEAAGLEPPVRYTCDLDGSLKEADVILAAASSERPLIHSGHLKGGAVVCDVARPSSVVPALSDQRDDLLIFAGGLVKLPKPIEFGSNLQGLPPGIALGCLAETALLAIEGDYRDHSIGRRLDLAEAEYIRSLAKKHGLRPALPRHYSEGKAAAQPRLQR